MKYWAPGTQTTSPHAFGEEDWGFVGASAVGTSETLSGLDQIASRHFSNWAGTKRDLTQPTIEEGNDLLDLSRKTYGSHRLLAWVAVGATMPGITRTILNVDQAQKNPTELAFEIERLLPKIGFPHRSSATMNVLQGRLQKLVSKLEQMRIRPEENEPPATEHAVMAAASTISEALALLFLRSTMAFGKVLNPAMTADDLGGIRVLWRERQRRVRVNFGATQSNRTYLYFEDSDHHGIEDLTGDNLAEKLNWLLR